MGSAGYRHGLRRAWGTLVLLCSVAAWAQAGTAARFFVSQWFGLYCEGPDLTRKDPNQPWMHPDVQWAACVTSSRTALFNDLIPNVELASLLLRAGAASTWSLCRTSPSAVSSTCVLGAGFL